MLNEIEAGKDYIVRAMTADGLIRAFAAKTTGTVEEARRRHNTSPVVTAALGRLLTAAGMMGFQMKGPEDSLTLKIKGDGPVGFLVAAADASGHVKGYAGEPQVLLHANAKGKLDVAGAVGKGELTVIKDLGLKEPYTGTIPLVSGEIAEDLTAYYANSEQTPSSVALGVLMNRNNTVRQAGGFIIQVMPGIDEDALDRLEQALMIMPPYTQQLDDGLEPEDILGNLLGEFGLIFTDREEVGFRCSCSREKVLKAIASLGRREVLDMTLTQEQVEAHCDYCNTSYTFSRSEMKELYKSILEKDKAGKKDPAAGPEGGLPASSSEAQKDAE